MFGQLNDADFPMISTFADAQRFMADTKPVSKGPNKGRIPLRSSRRSPDDYHIFETVGKHSMMSAKEGYIRVVHCRMFATNIVSFYSDGVITVDSYCSDITCKVQEAILRRVIRAAGFTSTPTTKVIVLSGTKVVPTTQNYMMRADNGHNINYVFPIDRNNDYLLLLPSKTDKGRYYVHNHGYWAGIGSKYPCQKIAKFVRQVQAQIRALRNMMPDYTPAQFHELLPGTSERIHGRTRGDIAAQIGEIMERVGWEEGKPLPNSKLNELLVDEENYWGRVPMELNERLTLRLRLHELRTSLKVPTEPRSPFANKWFCVTEKHAGEIESEVM